MSNSSKTRTTQQAIIDFNSVHGNRYDYSKYQYLSSRKKGIVICRTHGDFQMSYDKHYTAKQNCPNCAKNKKQDTEKCIELFNKKHGSRYDYSLVDYKGNRVAVKIICSVHGVFEQEPISHKNGRNCPDCSREKSIIKFEDILKDFHIIHGDYYVYDEKSYTKAENKMRIICPIHGEFFQRASQHKMGKGCKQCTMYHGWGKTPYLSRSHKYNGKSNLYICEMINSDERFIKVGIAYDGFKCRYKARERRKYNINLIAEYNGEAELIWDLETQILRSMHEYKYKPLSKFDGSTECLSDIDKSVFDCLSLLVHLGYLKRVL